MGAGIIAATFISEDGATVTAATLAASSLLDARLAFVSAFSGLWVGDLGVYAIARYLRPAARDSRWYYTTEAYLVPEGPIQGRLARISNLCTRHGIAAP